MNPTLENIHPGPSLKYPAWISAITGTIGATGLGLWWLLINNQSGLPRPGTREGKELLGHYLSTTHHIFLISLAIASLTLITLITRNSDNTPSPKKRSVIKNLIDFCREQPLVAILFTAYTVAMVHGTTWLYPEIVGWYRDVIDDHLLDNFALNKGFISETMRRDDFRFFPLAHQDLHLLSWFTAYVKVWILVSAAELIAIVILATRFVRRVSGISTQHGPALLLMTAILFMLYPSTASSFFQLIFCERFLSFIFILYISSYLHYQKTQSIRSFYSTCLFGLIGVFIKDIAIILFIGPPLANLLLGSMGWVTHDSKSKPKTTKRWVNNYRLELWLLMLIPIFLSSYILLSFIPSSYKNAGAYNQGKAIYFHADWRFWFLFAITAIRLPLAAAGRLRLHFLDALNVSCMGYAAAVYLLVGFHSGSYLSLPLQLITVLNLTWLWAAKAAPQLNRQLPWRVTGILGSAAAVMVVGLESTFNQTSFKQTVSDIWHLQTLWLDTYQKIERLTKEIKQNGEAVNIIYSENSWFSSKRHLNNLKFDRLIQYDPETETYTIKDGTDRKSIYHPKPGDLVINIDKSLASLKPILNKKDHILLYRNNDSEFSGAVFRLQ
jgi:hypothetical protein